MNRRKRVELPSAREDLALAWMGWAWAEESKWEWLGKREVFEIDCWVGSCVRNDIQAASRAAGSGRSGVLTGLASSRALRIRTLHSWGGD